jgi:MFS family permease
MGHAGGDDGTTLRIIGLVISVHVAGMYLFSPLVGLLADRAGRVVTVAVGGVLLLVAAALAGTAPPGAALQLGAGLLLLWLGWSCGLIAGSTLVTESVGPALRPTAQGGTDLLMGLSAAVAGLAGGPAARGRWLPARLGCLGGARGAAGRRVGSRIREGLSDRVGS